MKFINYKWLLEEISKKQEILLRISIWTYSSKRMTFTVPYEQVKQCLDDSMIFKYNDQNLKFSVGEKKFKFKLNELKIAKVDYVELKEGLL